MRRHLFTALVAVLPLIGGCNALDQLQTGFSTLGQQAAVSAMGLDQLSSQMVVLQAQLAFTMAFHTTHGWIEEAPYEPGEWTRWRGTTAQGKPSSFEKAFLARLEDGKEWWKVKFRDPEKGQDLIFEALYSADREQLLRMRSKLPDQEAAELPIEEGTAGIGRRPQRTLTKESREAAEQGTETVTVPAGTFTAEHMRWNSASGTADWYLSDKVPGRLVKHTITSKEEGKEGQHSLELEAFGADAKSELGSF